MIYGGDVTRAALSALDLTHSRKYVVVDVKVHMLMPGQCPAIPGWHVDGTPRHPDGSPAGGGLADWEMQMAPHFRPPIYHLIVTGRHCLTEFIHEPVPMVRDVATIRDPSTFAALHHHVETLLTAGALTKWAAPSCTVTRWDWWAVHQGVISTGHEWRYLIRVAETDTLPPILDLRKVLRMQQMVYSPLEFGW